MATAHNLARQRKLTPPAHTTLFQQQLDKSQKPNHTEAQNTFKIAPDNIGAQGANGPRGSQGNLSGIVPTYSHGKKMYISLDIHSYNSNKEISAVVKKYPNINFTLYLYERDKERIPALSKALPGTGFGLHIGPNGTTKQIEDFYEYVKQFQPTSKTPVSIHGEGSNRLPKSLMNKLDEYNVPFIRTADSKGKDSEKLKQVIPAGEQKIESFKTNPQIKDFNHYFTHPHEAELKWQSLNLKYLNDG